MKSKDVLLISDLDGTLLNCKQQISSQNLEAIIQFVKEGGSFAVATGRSPQASEQWLKILPINAPCIFYNGSLLCDYPSGKIYTSQQLQFSLFQEFLVYLQFHFPHVVIEIFTQEEGLCFISDKKYKDPFVEKEKNPHQFVHLDTLSQKSCYKILLCAEHEDLVKIEEVLKQMNLMQVCNIFYSQSFYLEITPKKSSKGKSLLHYRELPLYKDKKIVCVGDYDNDCEMFENADLSFAVGNASPKAKEIADWVIVDCDHHPFAQILNQIIK